MSELPKRPRVYHDHGPECDPCIIELHKKIAFLTELVTMTIDTTKLQSIDAELAGDVTQLIGIVQSQQTTITTQAAALANASAGDPATQAVIDSAVSALTTSAQQAEAAIAALVPATPAASATPPAAAPTT